MFLRRVFTVPTVEPGVPLRVAPEYLRRMRAVQIIANVIWAALLFGLVPAALAVSVGLALFSGPLWVISFIAIDAALRRFEHRPHLRLLDGRCPHCGHPYVWTGDQSAILCTECGKYYFDLIK